MLSNGSILQTQETAQRTYARRGCKANSYQIYEDAVNDDPKLREEIEAGLRSQGATDIPASRWSMSYRDRLLATLRSANADPVLIASLESLLLQRPEEPRPMVRRKVGSGVSPREATIVLLAEALANQCNMYNTVNYGAPNGPPPAVTALRTLEGQTIGDSEAYGSDSIFITPGGATMGVSMTMDFVARRSPKSRVLSVGPNYFQFASNAQFLDLDQVLVISEEAKQSRSGQVRFLPTVEEIEASLTPTTSTLVITQPNNPTGEFYDEEELRGIIQLAIDNDLLIIEDGAFEDLVFDECIPDFRTVAQVARVMGALDRVITVKSYSKGRNIPGDRLGWVASTNEEFITFAKADNQRKYDCPSPKCAGMVCLDALCRAVEMGLQRGTYDTIEQALEALMPMFPVGAISLPVTPELVQLYIDQRADDRAAYRNAFERIKQIDGVVCSNARAAYNVLVLFPEIQELQESDDRATILDLLLTVFARAGVEDQGGPWFGGTDEWWRKNCGFWVRISFSSDVEYLLDGIARIRRTVRTLIDDPSPGDRVRTGIAV